MTTLKRVFLVAAERVFEGSNDACCGAICSSCYLQTKLQYGTPKPTKFFQELFAPVRVGPSGYWFPVRGRKGVPWSLGRKAFKRAKEERIWALLLASEAAGSRRL